MSDLTTIQPNFAVRGAYSNSKALSGPGGADVQQESTFENLVHQAAKNAVDTIRDGDTIARAGLEGKVGVQEVVEATLAMESTLKVSVAVRDKLVEAYHEILKMPI